LQYLSYDKYIESGEYYKNKVVFISKTALKHTDESFRKQADSDHHHGPCLLLDLLIDLIACIPIGYTNNICLGVVKKIIKYIDSRSIKS